MSLRTEVPPAELARAQELLSRRARLRQVVRDPYRDDPVLWAREILGVHLWSRQRDVINAVRDEPAVAVRSGHGTGKTMTAATACLWFLDTHPRSRVVTTATKWSQVKNLLWHEVRQLHARGVKRGTGRPIFDATPLLSALYLPDGRYALGLASRPGNAESFSGHHAPDILLVYDEASGVLPEVFEVGEGYMTTQGARKLLIGNPTRNSGEFFDAFHSKRAEYNTVHISAEESPAVTGEWVPDDVRAALTGPEWIDGRRKAWGEDSPLFQVRVLGNFAEMGEYAVIGLAAVEAAQERECEPDLGDVQIGVDVARFGDDETVIAVREGNRVRLAAQFVGHPTTDTAGKAKELAARYDDPLVVVDDSGVGGGVTDQLRADGLRVQAFNGGERAHHAKLFPNRRTELWFEAAARIDDIDLDRDDQLAADLIAPEYSYDTDLRRVVEKKEKTKRRLGRSPDRGDSVLLTLARPEVAEMLVSKRERPRGPNRRRKPPANTLPAVQRRLTREAMKR